MRMRLRAVIGIDPVLQFGSGEQASRFDDGALTVDPFGFNRVEPGALGWQRAGQDTNPLPGMLDRAVMGAQPGADGGTDMPGGVIPDHEQRLAASSSGLLRTPGQELDG